MVSLKTSGQSRIWTYNQTGHRWRLTLTSSCHQAAEARRWSLISLLLDSTRPPLRRSCRSCRSCASQHPPRPLLWLFLCWSSWRRSSCSSRTPPNWTSASRASAGLWWWASGLKHFCWMEVHLIFLAMYFQDFLRCVTASIIYFIVSIVAVSRYMDGSSKAAGVHLSSQFVF